MKLLQGSTPVGQQQARSFPDRLCVDDLCEDSLCRPEIKTGGGQELHEIFIEQTNIRNVILSSWIP